MMLSQDFQLLLGILIRPYNHKGSVTSFENSNGWLYVISHPIIVKVFADETPVDWETFTLFFDNITLFIFLVNVMPKLILKASRIFFLGYLPSDRSLINKDFDNNRVENNVEPPIRMLKIFNPHFTIISSY